MSAHEKAAGMLDTSEAALKTTHVESTPQAKHLTTLIAQFAVAGHEVHRLADGGFLVSRWGMSRVCPDLDALVGFARQIGVTQ